MPVIKIKLEKGHTFINPNDILYVEASNKHSFIYFSNLEKLKSNYPLKLIAVLLEEPIFYRIHDSFIINCSFFKSINSHHVILQGNNEVPISRNKKKLFEKNMEKYFNLVGA